jgi:hypothetical protein
LSVFFDASLGIVVFLVNTTVRGFEGTAAIGISYVTRVVGVVILVCAIAMGSIHAQWVIAMRLIVPNGPFPALEILPQSIQLA